MEDNMIYVELLSKNIEKNYIYIAYYGKNYTDGTNGSLDLKDFEEKTGIVWDATGTEDIGERYESNKYIPKLVMGLELFLSIKRGI